MTTHDRCQHKHYRMECAEFDQLIQRAGDRCEICRVSGPESAYGKLFIDHDARLGRWAVRGLLCGKCNSGIGESWHTPQVQRYLANPWRGPEDRHRAVVDFRKIRYVRARERAQLARDADRREVPWQEKETT